jgi:hypothetical protein
VTDHHAVFDFDERAQLVAEATAIAFDQRIDIVFVEPVGRWLVVLRHIDRERHLERAGDGYRWNPGHRGDGTLDAHGSRR